MTRNHIYLIGGIILVLFFGLFLTNQLLVGFKIKAQDSAKIRTPVLLKNDLKKNYSSKEKIKIELYNDDQNVVSTVLKNKNNKEIDTDVLVSENAGVTTLSITPPLQFEPGKYFLEIKDQTNKTISREFWWGVLAINPNKPIYTVGEKANLAMAVLDEFGNMVCDAKVQLRITNYELRIDEALSTDNGKIIVNPECNSHDFTLKSDYEAEYQIDKVGKYTMELTAITKNGQFVITDSFEAKNSMDFDVERVSATRIFPPHNYPMTINIIANKDFKGDIYETIPISFQIEKTMDVGVRSFGEVNEDNGKKRIRWNVDMKKGDKISLGYKYKAPNISPQFYLTGPLTMTTLTDLVYEEGRQWQIAADATDATIRQEINIIDGAVTAGGTDAALINIDTTKYNNATYYFEVVASQGAGNTLTVNLSTGNTQSVSIGITDTTTLIRSRKVFTPESGSFDYRLNVVTGTTHSIKAARVIIIQTAAAITATQTQIEIGNLEIGLSNTTTAPLTSPKYWKYDSSLWDGSLTFEAEATYMGVGVSAGSQVFTTPGLNTYTAAAGLTGVMVEAWGGGGAGAGTSATRDGGGGGGGGAYSNDLNLAVTAGVGYTAYVGLGGTGRQGFKGGDGGNSYFINTSTVLAIGGSAGNMTAGAGGAGGAGGNASAGVGDTKWSGGAGGAGRTAAAGVGGPGGSSAGIAAVGWSGPSPWLLSNNLVAQIGPVGSGIGGSGGSVGANGAAPSSGNGGGGGGAGETRQAGGNATNGKIVVTWQQVAPSMSIYLQQDDGAFGGWTNVATIFSGGTETVPTRVRSSSFNPTSGRNYRMVAVSNAGIFNIYNAKIIVTQAGTINKLEPQYLLLNTKSTTVGSTLGYSTLWDSTEWARTTNVYKHAMDAIGVGASSMIVDVNNSNVAVTNSPIVGANQQIGVGMTMPVTGHVLDTWLNNAGTEVDASRILVQVTINADTPATGPILDQIMRHGMWFLNGVRQVFTF